MKKQSLKSQSSWIMFAKVAGFGLAALLPILVVRILTQDQVGLYRQSFQVIINAVSVLPLGISMSAYYFLARDENKRPAAVLNILLVNFVMGGLAFCGLYFYPQFLGRVFQSAEMTALAPKIGVVIWLWIFSTFLEVVALANQEARTATLFIILAQFTKTVLMAGAILTFGTVEAFIYAAMIQGALQTVILVLYLNFKFPEFWRSFDPVFFREHLYYAVPFGVAGLMWTLQTDIHNYFVGFRFTEAEYAVYAYGCFQLPLVAVLYESMSAVLIPRMSQLQASGNHREMVLLAARAMHKLSLFYFPLYVFLLITAQVFVITLFTRDYLASVPIMLINLTLLPLDIWVIDPLVRAHKELGKILITTRLIILIALVAALFFGIQHFDLRGMIAIVVVTSIIDRLCASAILVRRLGLKQSDWSLLTDVGKNALICLVAGVITFLAFRQLSSFAFDFGQSLTRMYFEGPSANLTDFFSGAITLGLTLLVFAPLYLVGIFYFGVVDREDREWIAGLAGGAFAVLFRSSKRDKAD